MKLTDLDAKNVAKRALKESYGIDLNLGKVGLQESKKMLKQVSKLIYEAKLSPSFHRAQHTPAYMKLKFMEQALTTHVKSLPRVSPRIIVENEEVEKSQVILAAQDMVDTVQKYYEDINDMMVKELPALVDSIQSEIGVNESDAYSQTVGEALNTLNSALQEAKSTLQSALGQLTGQPGADAFGADAGSEIDDAEMDLDTDIDADLGTEDDLDLGDDLGNDSEAEDDLELPPLPDFDEEEPALSGAGRPKR